MKKNLLYILLLPIMVMFSNIIAQTSAAITKTAKKAKITKAATTKKAKKAATTK